MLEPFLARPSQQAKATVSVPAGARSEYSANESEIGFQRALSAGPTALARPRWPERPRPVLAEGDKFSQGTGRRGRVESQAAALECRGEKNGRAPAVFTWGEPPQQSCSPSLKRARARTPSAPEVPAAASSSGVERCPRMESGRAASRCGGLLAQLRRGAEPQHLLAGLFCSDADLREDPDGCVTAPAAATAWSGACCTDWGV